MVTNDQHRCERARCHTSDGSEWSVSHSDVCAWRTRLPLIENGLKIFNKFLAASVNFGKGPHKLANVDAVRN